MNMPWGVLWLAMLLIAAAAAGAAMGFRGQGEFAVVLAFVVCLAAGLFDAATAHVPNALTYTAILAGLAASALAAVLGWAGLDPAVRFLGAAGPTSALLGVLLGAGISAVCMMFTGMGGGDAKMLMALGALLGWKPAAGVMVYALAIAVAYSLLNLIIAGRLGAMLARLALHLLNLLVLRELPRPAAGRAGVPIAVAFAAALPLARLFPPDRLAAWLRGGAA